MALILFLFLFPLVIKSLTVHFCHHLQFVCKLFFKIILDPVHFIIFIHPELQKNNLPGLSPIHKSTGILPGSDFRAKYLGFVYTSGSFWKLFPVLSPQIPPPCDDWLKCQIFSTCMLPNPNARFIHE